MEEKESETKSRGGWNGGASQNFLPEVPLETLHDIWAGARIGPAVGLQTQGTSGPACGSSSLTPGLSWESRDETGQLKHFRAAMTSVLVPKINAPQTRQCGQGLRTYCKYQPGVPISVPMTLWGAGPGQPHPNALSSHHRIQGKALAWTFFVKLSQGPLWRFGGGILPLQGGLRLRV